MSYYSSKEYAAKKDAAIAKAKREKALAEKKERDTKKVTKKEEPSKEIFVEDEEIYVSETDSLTSTEEVIVDVETVSTIRTTELSLEEILEEETINAPISPTETVVDLERQNLTYELSEEQIKANEIAVKKQKAKELVNDYVVKNEKYEGCLVELRQITDLKLRKQKESICFGLKNELEVSKSIYENFVGIEAQQVVPSGFHQMPDGSLMANVEHHAYESLPKCGDNQNNIDGVKTFETKIITGIDFDKSDILGAETKRFVISATNGSVFSLEIKRGSDGKYYNFYSKSFTSAHASLKSVTVYGSYEFFVEFPAQDNATTYDIFLIAENGTKHSKYQEVLLEDNTIDLNSSKGSDSVLLHKQLRGISSATRNLTYELTAKSPNSVAHLSDHASITGLSKKKSTMLNLKTAFEFSVTSGNTKAYQIIRQPTSEDIFVEVTRTIGSAPIFLDGEDLSSSTHFSWPLNNIDGLTEDMIPIGTNVTADSAIKYYENIVTSLENTACANEFVTARIEGLTKTSPPTIARNATSGVLVTTQLGNVVFDKQQAAALAGGSIKFLAYGPEKIKELTGWELEFTDLKVELTAPTTTTTQSTVNLTTVTVASGDGIADDVSTVSGIGITGDGTGAPKVTNIAGYSTSVNTATITFDSAQTLENGATLTFLGAGKTITISGNIAFNSQGKGFGSNYELPNWDGKFYFDLEKFITPTVEA